MTSGKFVAWIVGICFLLIVAIVWFILSGLVCFVNGGMAMPSLLGYTCVSMW